MSKPLPAVLLLLALAPLELGAKGCEVATVGEDAPQSTTCVVGLSNDAACGEGEYCDYSSASCGAVDGTGACKPIPEACTEEFDPVCGCNGVTYGNACTANAAGVSGLRGGECPPPGSCGGLHGGACAAGEFCNYAQGAFCGAADATGVCTPFPETCPTVDDPVCGCDGMTYSNSCGANVAGVSVAHAGECDSTNPGEGACGGLLGLTCADSEFCSYAADAFCGAADATGTCTPKPESCDAVYDPVCGCDGVTYGSECEANLAGISSAAAGECDEPPPTSGAICGGLLGAGCPADQYCNFDEPAQCGAADATGLCAEKPTGCTGEFVPVCGCNGVTYSNACVAASAGVSVASQGECP